MTGLVGMVAKRGGKVLGVVRDVWTCPAGGHAEYPSRMALALTETGTPCEFDTTGEGVTFHPADPAPHPSFESVRLDAWRVAEGISRKYKGLRQSLRTTLGLRAEATDAEIVERVRGLVAVASFRPGAVVHAPDPVSGRWMPVQPEAAPADQMTADPPPARASGRRVKIAAQLARGETLPRSGRLSARESKRLEQQHRDAAVALRKAHDEIAYPLSSGDRKREETPDE